MNNQNVQPPIYRIGILGAARIAPRAVIYPAQSSTTAEVVAVAARDIAKARDFAARHKLARAYGSYDELIADPEIDAIYNPLPNSHHAEWSIRALEAGKHVLCEKPIASNVAEAQEMASAANRTGNVLMEAFHYRYHPLMERVLTILASGEIGTIRHVETTMCIPLYRRGDIRWRYELAGGALMDVGCYTIHLARTLAGSEPAVNSARAWMHSPQVDRAVKADLTFANGITGHIHCSMWSTHLFNLGAKIIGDKGQVTIRNPYVPQLYNRISVRTAAGTRHEHPTRTPTYNYQLDAFVQAIQNRTPFPTNMQDAIANMHVIDDIYRAIGLQVRGT